MELMRVLAGYVASACLGIAVMLSIIDWVVSRLHEEQDRAEGCLAHLLTGIMLVASLIFGLLAVGMLP